MKDQIRDTILRLGAEIAAQQMSADAIDHKLFCDKMIEGVERSAKTIEKHFRIECLAVAVSAVNEYKKAEKAKTGNVLDEVFGGKGL